MNTHVKENELPQEIENIIIKSQKEANKMRSIFIIIVTLAICIALALPFALALRSESGGRDPEIVLYHPISYDSPFNMGDDYYVFDRTWTYHYFEDANMFSEFIARTGRDEMIRRLEFPFYCRYRDDWYFISPNDGIRQFFDHEATHRLLTLYGEHLSDGQREWLRSPHRRDHYELIKYDEDRYGRQR